MIIISVHTNERNDSMDKTPAWLQNAKIKECFDGLPKATQEAVMQSTAGFNSAEDLMKFSENYNGSSKKG